MLTLLSQRTFFSLDLSLASHLILLGMMPMSVSLPVWSYLIMRNRKTLINHAWLLFYLIFQIGQIIIFLANHLRKGQMETMIDTSWLATSLRLKHSWRRGCHRMRRPDLLPERHRRDWDRNRREPWQTSSFSPTCESLSQTWSGNWNQDYIFSNNLTIKNEN